MCPIFSVTFISGSIYICDIYSFYIYFFNLGFFKISTHIHIYFLMGHKSSTCFSVVRYDLNLTFMLCFVCRMGLLQNHIFPVFTIPTLPCI